MLKRPYVAAIVATVAVSFAAIFIRWSDSHPFTISLYRLLFTSILLTPFMIRRARSEVLVLQKKDFLLFFAVGVVLAFHFAFWITALEVTSVASSVILVHSHPIMVAFLAHLFLGERVTRLTSLGIALGFFGIIIIGMADYHAGASHFLGDIYALAGGAAAGVYILAGRRLRQRVSLVPYAFTVYICAVSVLALLSIAAGVPLIPVSNVWRELALFLALALIPTILGHTLFNWSLGYLPATFVSIILLGEPVGASILAFILLNEQPTSNMMVGGAAALLGIYLVSKATFRKG